MEQCCNICGAEFDNFLHRDLGGDCLKCTAEIAKDLDAIREYNFIAGYKTACAILENDPGFDYIGSMTCQMMQEDTSEELLEKLDQALADRFLYGTGFFVHGENEGDSNA